jgi:hypothetical protein
MAAEPTALSALPHALLVHRILALLPADARARCATVCRGWRALLDDPSLWARLDLSQDSGVTVRVSRRVLRGAAVRAGGALAALHVNRFRPSDPALLEVVTANAGTLRELRTGPIYGSTDELAALLRAAPALCELSASAVCSPEQAAALLRNDPPFGPLRMHTLCVRHGDADGDASVLELAAAMPAHASLRSLELSRVNLQSDAECGALVDAALAVQLQSLELMVCRLQAVACADAALRAMRLPGPVRQRRVAAPHAHAHGCPPRPCGARALTAHAPCSPPPKRAPVLLRLRWQGGRALPRVHAGRLARARRCASPAGALFCIE